MEEAGECPEEASSSTTLSCVMVILISCSQLGHDSFRPLIAWAAKAPAEIATRKAPQLILRCVTFSKFAFAMLR